MARGLALRGGEVSGMLRCACFGKGAAAESGAYDEGAAKVLCEADRGDACVFVTALKLRDGAGGPEGGGMRVGIALRHAASRGEQVRRAQPGRKMRHRICSSVCRAPAFPTRTERAGAICGPESRHEGASKLPIWPSSFVACGGRGQKLHSKV